MITDKETIQKAVEETLCSRIETQGLKGKAALKEECSFLCGAASALQAIFGEKDTLSNYIPPIWMIAPMTGRSVLKERENSKKEVTS